MKCAYVTLNETEVSSTESNHITDFRYKTEIEPSLSVLEARYSFGIVSRTFL